MEWVLAIGLLFGAAALFMLGVMLGLRWLTGGLLTWSLGEMNQPMRRRDVMLAYLQLQLKLIADGLKDTTMMGAGFVLAGVALLHAAAARRLFDGLMRMGRAFDADLGLFDGAEAYRPQHNPLIRPLPHTPTGHVLRDIVVLEGKLLIDGVRDAVMSALAFWAMLGGVFLEAQVNRGRMFCVVVWAGRLVEEWVDTFEAHPDLLRPWGFKARSAAP